MPFWCSFTLVLLFFWAAPIHAHQPSFVVATTRSCCLLHLFAGSCLSLLVCLCLVVLAGPHAHCCRSLHLLVPIPCSPLAHCCFQFHCCRGHHRYCPHWDCIYIHMPTPHLSHRSFAALGHASHSHLCCVLAYSPLHSPFFALIHLHVHVCPAIHLLIWFCLCSFGPQLLVCSFVLICACFGSIVCIKYTVHT